MNPLPAILAEFTGSEARNVTHNQAKIVKNLLELSGYTCKTNEELVEFFNAFPTLFEVTIPSDNTVQVRNLTNE